jgi:hypothetical protein
MKTRPKDEMTDELRPEYDLRELLANGVRGKYAKRYRAETNLVLPEPEVAKVFPQSDPPMVHCKPPLIGALHSVRSFESIMGGL